MRALLLWSIYGLLCLLILSCDPESSAAPPAAGLVGKWKLVDYTGVITTQPTDGGEARHVDVRTVAPTNYLITFTEGPRRVTSLGATTLERSARDGSQRDTVMSAGSIRGTVAWELAGSTLTLQDEDGYTQDATVVTLNERELAISYDIRDSTFLPYYLLRSQATQLFERR